MSERTGGSMTEANFFSRLALEEHIMPEGSKAGVCTSQVVAPARELIPDQLHALEQSPWYVAPITGIARRWQPLWRCLHGLQARHFFVAGSGPIAVVKIVQRDGRSLYLCPLFWSP